MRPRHLLVVMPTLLLLAAPARPAHALTGWQWPVPPPHVVVRGFAPPLHDWLPGHRGVDLAADSGVPVVAAGAGRVVFAGSVAGVPAVTVRHPDGLETTYEPVRPLVHAGSEVAAGAVLGDLVAKGSHCAPRACLHWGLRRGQVYLDPLTLVGAARVRLLPLLSDSSGASWLAPALSGASVGSSAVAVGWAGLVLRKRRRRLPPGVVSLSVARRQRADAQAPADADARA